MGELGQRTRHFDPGRAGTDQDEGQQTLAQHRIGCGFGLLEAKQRTPADQGRVVERFEAGCA